MVQTFSGHCRACQTERRFRFLGWATDDGVENGVRPRAVLNACSACGHVVLQLGNVSDAEGLCENIVRKRLGRGGGRIETEDAVAFLQVHLWRLYLDWRPDTLSFMSYASHWLPVRLGKWIIEVTGVDDRRQSPKPHAVSGPLEDAEHVGILEEHARARDASASGLDARRLGGALGRGEADPTDDRLGDLGWLLRDGDREGAEGAGRGRLASPRQGEA